MLSTANNSLHETMLFLIVFNEILHCILDIYFTFTMLLSNATNSECYFINILLLLLVSKYLFFYFILMVFIVSTANNSLHETMPERMLC